MEHMRACYERETHPTENSLQPRVILPAASCTGHSRPQRDLRQRKYGIKQPVPACIVQCYTEFTICTMYNVQCSTCTCTCTLYVRVQLHLEGYMYMYMYMHMSGGHQENYTYSMSQTNVSTLTCTCTYPTLPLLYPTLLATFKSAVG